MEMKLMTIGNLLGWAFTQELPKIGATQVTASGPGFSANTAQAQMQELGTLIDRSPNPYGVIPYFSDEGDPHPDALIVAQAVRALADRDGYEVGSGWTPFPEWEDDHGVISAEVEKVIAAETGRGGKLNSKQIVNLVTSAAILKRGPDWRADQPKIVTIKANGKDDSWFIKRTRIDKKTGRMEEYEDNGFDARKRKPKAAAYRKYRLDGSIRGAVVARLEWQLWQSALEVLAEDLQGRLHDHKVIPFRANRAPWLASQTLIETLDTV
jgi:hypothetical protein